VSAYGPFELAPLEAVVVPERPAPGAAPSLDAVREQAFEEGFAAGVAQAQSQLDGPASALAAAADQLQAMRSDAAASVEVDAVDLALRIAEQAIGAASRPIPSSSSRPCAAPCAAWSSATAC
jgi:hypothetical protein